MTMAPRHALVFGASGIAGWAICKELLASLQPYSFSSVIGVTLHPLSDEDSGIPKDSRLQIVSGIDLSLPSEQVKEKLQNTNGISRVTHVYYASIAMREDPQERVDINVDMLKAAVTATDELCPLEFFLIQTGSMYYGLEYAALIPYNPPFAESRPRICEPYYANIYYYPQLDFISSYASQKKWHWAESRSDMIAGFVPRGNVMNILGSLALYLATYRYVYGAGATVKFPGSEKGWKTRTIDCDQTLLARFNIFLSTAKKNESNGQPWNIGDGEISTWSYRFPRIAEWFGLQGVCPSPGEDEGEKAESWWRNIGSNSYAKMVQHFGLKERHMGDWQWTFMRTCTTTFCYDRFLDLGKAKALGWDKFQDPSAGYLRGLEEYASHRIIPKWEKEQDNISQ